MMSQSKDSEPKVNTTPGDVNYISTDIANTRTTDIAQTDIAQTDNNGNAQYGGSI